MIYAENLMARVQPAADGRLHEEVKTRIIKSELCVRAQGKTFSRYKVGAMVTQQENEALLEEETSVLKPPSMYRVMLLNDDFTPMDFVIFVLQEYFHKDRETATRIMLKVHREGKGVCGIFPKDIANTKVEQVVRHARQEGHPLLCTMEEA